MFTIVMKEYILIVVVDDLDLDFIDVVFEAKVFNRYSTFDWITKRNMEDPSYAYLHCDLLNTW